MQGVENTESSLIKPSPNSQHHCQQYNYNVISIPITNQINSSSISSQRHSAKNGNQLIYRSIQKGRQSRFEFQKFLYIDYCLMLFCFINVALSLLYYDADFVGKDNIAKWCLILCELFSIIQIIVTILRYQVLIGLQKSQKILQQQQTIHSSGKIYQIIIQICVILIQPYSFFNNIKIRTQNIYDNFTFDYKINYILVVLGFAKIYIVIRVLLLRQLYMSPRSSRLCRMYGCQSNYVYAIKCLFKDSPLTLIGLVFTTSIIIFAISLRIAERNLVYEYPKYFNGKQYKHDLQTFQNALWLTIITMTTVGYGDFFPRTIFGRVIDVVLVIWGTFIVSLMVVVLTNTLNMDQSQKRALIVLNRLQTKKSLKEAAAFVITHCCRKFLIKDKVAKRLRPPLNDDERIKLQSAFYKYLSNFQSIRRTIRSMYQIDDVYEEMTRQFQFINDEVSVLLASQQQTIISIHSHINQQRIRKNQQVNNPLYQNRQMDIHAKNRQSQQEQS